MGTPQTVLTVESRLARVSGWGQGRQWHRKPRGWDKTRDRIALRDQYTCQKCGRITAKGHCSHIIPQAKGGSDLDDNLRWLCEDCNMQEAQAESMRSRGAKPKARIGVEGWPTG